LIGHGVDAFAARLFWQIARCLRQTAVFSTAMDPEAARARRSRPRAIWQVAGCALLAVFLFGQAKFCDRPDTGMKPAEQTTGWCSCRSCGTANGCLYKFPCADETNARFPRKSGETCKQASETLPEAYGCCPGTVRDN